MLPLQFVSPIDPAAPDGLVAKAIVRLHAVKQFLVDSVAIRSKVVRPCASCCLPDVVVCEK